MAWNSREYGKGCPEVYGHRNGESLANRLLTGAYFPGGNPEVVKAGMLLLELLSLNDHRQDFTEDLINGKSNPLITHLNYDEEKGRIEKDFFPLDEDIQKAFSGYYDKVIVCGNWL